MKLRPLNILGALYLFLFIFIVLAWANDSLPFVQGTLSFDWIPIPHETKSFKCDLKDGNVTVEFRNYYPNPYYDGSGPKFYFTPGRLPTWSPNWYGFSFERSRLYDYDEPEWYTANQFGAPAWFLCLYSLILPTWLVYRRFRAKHAPKPAFPIASCQSAPPAATST